MAENETIRQGDNICLGGNYLRSIEVWDHKRDLAVHVWPRIKYGLLKRIVRIVGLM